MYVKAKTLPSLIFGLPCDKPAFCPQTGVMRLYVLNKVALLTLVLCSSVNKQNQQVNRSTLYGPHPTEVSMHWWVASQPPWYCLFLNDAAKHEEEKEVGQQVRVRWLAEDESEEVVQCKGGMSTGEGASSKETWQCGPWGRPRSWGKAGQELQV